MALDKSNRLSIEYPSEILWALQKEPDEFEREARLLLALKFYESGKLSTGLAARIAGISRLSFIFLLAEYGLSPFGESPDELKEDFDHARRASHRQ
jgi:predicted HTH domain antitoxin